MKRHARHAHATYSSFPPSSVFSTIQLLLSIIQLLFYHAASFTSLHTFFSLIMSSDFFSLSYSPLPLKILLYSHLLQCPATRHTSSSQDIRIVHCPILVSSESHRSKPHRNRFSSELCRQNCISSATSCDFRIAYSS